MKYLVTGATGFVGSYFCKRLIEQGHKVVGLVRNRNFYSNLDYYGLKSEMDIIEGSLDGLQLPSCLLRYEFDFILHFGAEAIVKRVQETPLQAIRTNVGGTAMLLEYARLYNKSLKCFMFMSTDKVYGCEENATEQSPYQVTCPYSASKIAAEQICKAYLSTYNVPVLIVRACNIYGPGDYNRRVIPNTIESILSSSTAVLFEGDNKMFREYIYIEDLYRAISFLLERYDFLSEYIFNIAPTTTDCVISTEGIVKKLCEFRPKVSIIHKPRKSYVEITSQSLSSERLRKLGWQSQYTLDKGLKETFSWYEKHIDYFQKIRKR